MYLDYTYIPVKSRIFFLLFFNVTHKANCEQNVMLVIWVDQKRPIHYKNLFVLLVRKASLWSFVIVFCSLPLSFLLYLNRKISYFGPGKGLNCFVQNKWGWVISANLWEYFVFSENVKKKEVAFFNASYNRKHKVSLGGLRWRHKRKGELVSLSVCMGVSVCVYIVST